jgi:PTH1 family peptidyl-tRNA hydrolase
MKIIVGLGNPDKKYEHTRHNAGWLILDWLIADLGFLDLEWQKKFDAQVLEIHNSPLSPLILRGGVMIVKPQTFMNNSGEAIKKICDFYKIAVTKNLLVIHDDTDLPLGTIRANSSSSSAGHKGVQDIIDKLGTQEFHRLRIGVETRADKSIPPTDDFVLQNFTDEELKKLYDDVFPKTKLEIEKFIGNLKFEI